MSAVRKESSTLTKAVILYDRTRPLTGIVVWKGPPVSLTHTYTPFPLSGSCVGWLRVTEPVTAAADNSPSQSLRWRVSLIFFFSSPSLEAWSLFTLYTACNLSGFNTLSVFRRPPGWPLSHQLPVWKVASQLLLTVLLQLFSPWACYKAPSSRVPFI